VRDGPWIVAGVLTHFASFFLLLIASRSGKGPPRSMENVTVAMRLSLSKDPVLYFRLLFSITFTHTLVKKMVGVWSCLQYPAPAMLSPEDYLFFFITLNVRCIDISVSDRAHGFFCDVAIDPIHM